MSHSDMILPAAVIKIRQEMGFVITLCCLANQGNKSSYIGRVGEISVGDVSSIVFLTIQLEDGSEINDRLLVMEHGNQPISSDQSAILWQEAHFTCSCTTKFKHLGACFWRRGSH